MKRAMTSEGKMDNENLKNCPACGGTAVIYETEDNTVHIECEICGVGVFYGDEGTAREVWNSGLGNSPLDYLSRIDGII